MVVVRDNRSDLQRRTQSASVRSILALAGGAAVLPLSESPVNAAIIVDASLSGTVIGWNTGASQTPSVSRALPGGGGFAINTRATAGGGPAANNLAGVFAARINSVGVSFRRRRRYLNSSAYLASVGASVGGGTAAGASANVNLGSFYAGTVNDLGNSAFSGTSKYLLFSFNNSGTTNYGWIELTAATTGSTGGGLSQYSATLGSWAYDNSGATILAGQTVPVPEPATATLAMGGALVAGAAGLRRWRKRRAARVAPAGEQA